MSFARRLARAGFIACALLLFTIPGFTQTAIVQVDQTQGQAPALAATPVCTQSADFCMQPTFDTVSDPVAVAQGCNAVQIPQTLKLVAFCQDPFTGAAIPGANMTLTLQAQDGTGGHIHTDPGRPAGKFDPDSGLVSTTDNTLHTTFTAPDLSGTVVATASGILQDGTPCFPTTATIATEFTGLSAIPVTGLGYETTTSVGHDGNNIFANPSVGTNLQRLPFNFDILAQALMTAGFVSTQPIPNLVYTSIALPFGGLFDVDSNSTGSITNPWHPPHCGHRRGFEADLRIRNIPLELRPALIGSIQDSHFRMPVKTENPSAPNATHWHLRAN
jgi:hypothetical protein